MWLIAYPLIKNVGLLSSRRLLFQQTRPGESREFVATRLLGNPVCALGNPEVHESIEATICIVGLELGGIVENKAPVPSKQYLLCQDRKQDMTSILLDRD